MTNEQHTPGPWFRAAHDSLTIRGDSGNQADKTLAIVSDVYEFGGYLPAQTEANATLIVAVTDLLAALVAIVEDHDERIGLFPDSESQPNRIKTMQAGREAIAKATVKP